MTVSADNEPKQLFRCPRCMGFNVDLDVLSGIWECDDSDCLWYGEEPEHFNVAAYAGDYPQDNPQDMLKSS